MLLYVDNNIVVLPMLKMAASICSILVGYGAQVIPPLVFADKGSDASHSGLATMGDWFVWPLAALGTEGLQGATN